MEQVLKRLGYRAGDKCLVLNAPKGVGEQWPALMQPQPEEEAKGDYPLVSGFYEREAAFLTARQALVDALAQGGRLWVCYPKKSSKNYQSDLTRDSLWPLLGDWGMEPVSQYAVDDDWSAIRFRPVAEIKSMVRKRAATAEGAERAKVERGAKEKPEG